MRIISRRIMLQWVICSREAKNRGRLNRVIGTWKKGELNCSSNKIACYYEWTALSVRVLCKKNFNLNKITLNYYIISWKRWWFVENGFLAQKQLFNKDNEVFWGQILNYEKFSDSFSVLTFLWQIKSKIFRGKIAGGWQKC